MGADPNPVYLIAGGRSARVLRGPDPLMQEALRLAAVVRPSVAYVGAASEDASAFLGMIERRLAESGAGNVRLAPLCGVGADPPKAMRIIEGSHIVFLSGGDVEAGMKILQERGMADFFRDQYRMGKPFFGLSAGSIMLAKEWVRWQDPDDDSTAELFPCLGLAPVICDTHAEADGWEELKAALGLKPEGVTGYGITSGACLKVLPEGGVEALGGPIARFTHRGGKIKREPDLVPGGPAGKA